MRIVNCQLGRHSSALCAVIGALTSFSLAQAPLSGRLLDRQFKSPLGDYWIEWSTPDSIEAAGTTRSQLDGRFRFEAGVPSDLPIDLVVLDPDRRPVAWVPGVVPRVAGTLLAIAVPAGAQDTATDPPVPASAETEKPRKKGRLRRWLTSPGGSTALVVVLAAVVAVGADRLTNDPPAIDDNPSPSSP